MMVGRRAAFVALAVLATALSSERATAQSSRDAASSAARALLDAARQYAGVGDWPNAQAYLAEALLQDPGDSDALYLDALASVKSGRVLDEPLGGLNAALASGRFSFYTPRDASILKAELLVRERLWKEALDALGVPSAASGADPAFRLLRARAYAGMGDKASFASELREALKRFPDDPAFPRLFLTRAGSVPSSDVERELGRTILGRLPRYLNVDPEIGVLAAPLMPDVSARRDAIQAYRATGGSSPAATLRALEYGIIDERAAVAELLPGSRPVALSDLVSLLALAGSPAGRDAVSAAITAWKGEIDTDADRDGIAEGAINVASGLTTGWKLDTKQEGRWDFKASFTDGAPVSVIVDRPGLEIDVDYSAYPAVASIAFIDKVERRSYSFAPEAYSYAPLAMRPFVGEGRSAMLLPYAASVPDPSERSCAVAALNVAIDSGATRRLTVLANGVPLSSTYYEDGRLVSMTSYELGRPLLERIDADGDGRFEAERGFTVAPDGSFIPAWQRVDSKGDGVFDYREQLIFPFRKEWDYDRDGSVDAVQFQLSDGSIEQQFSSRLDGRLDETLIVKDGKIIAISRNGTSLALLPDSNAKLTWIGKKVFDLGSNLPEGEGIFSNMSMRYRVTRIGDLAFAELIP